MLQPLRIEGESSTTWPSKPIHEKFIPGKSQSGVNSRTNKAMSLKEWQTICQLLANSGSITYARKQDPKELMHKALELQPTSSLASFHIQVSLCTVNSIQSDSIMQIKAWHAMRDIYLNFQHCALWDVLTCLLFEKTTFHIRDNWKVSLLYELSCEFAGSLALEKFCCIENSWKVSLRCAF